MSISSLFRTVLTALLAYALGNLNGSIIVSKALYHSDVRDAGSGNGGLTNFLRVYGKKAAPLVIFVDVGKAVLSTLLGGWLMGSFAAVKIGQAFGLLCVVLGHMFPALYGFHGGKGVLAGISSIFVLDWRVGLILFCSFALILYLTRYVSLGSVICAAALPVLVQLFLRTPLATLLCVIAGGMVIFMHRSNIKRLLNGNENKFTF